MSSEPVTIKEIAKSLGMSSTTVSRVLNGQSKKYRISARTEQIVRDTALKLDFRPNQVARNLRLQKTNTIGLVIPDISNPFFAKLARAADNELRSQGKFILLSDTHDDTQLEKETISLLLDRKVDGLLIAPVGLEFEHFKSLENIPIVLIDRYFDELNIPYASTDNFEAALKATQYLIRKGHHDIACIQGLTNTKPNKERVRGFYEAVNMSGIAKGGIVLAGSDFSIENGLEVTRELLRQPKVPTAIFALNNQIAIGALKAINDANLRIPADISVISFDDQPYFELTSPPITTVRQPVYDLGTEAVKMLFELMNNNPVKNKLLPGQIIERKSVRALNS